MMERIDAYVLGFVGGVVFSAGAVGVYQVLVTKGFDIATNLVGAGWTHADLRAHRKVARVMPLLQRAREEGQSPR